MTNTLPASVVADGNLKVVWVPTLADPANPTVAEVTAPSCVDLSCYLTGDGWTPSVDKQVVTDDRLCSRQTFERRGRHTDKLAIKYIYRAQEPTAATNAAYKTLKDGTEGYLVERWGAAYEDALAAGDQVNVTPAQCGIQEEMPPTANGVLNISQDVYVTNAKQRQVAVVS